MAKFKENDRVEHEIFGKGIILHVNTGESTYLTRFFGGYVKTCRESSLTKK